MMVTLGDGICDLELNTDDCRFDYGDCCDDSEEHCGEILDIGLDYNIMDYSKDKENYPNQYDFDFISISSSSTTTSLIEYQTNQYTHPCKYIAVHSAQCVKMRKYCFSSFCHLLILAILFQMLVSIRYVP